MNLDRLNAVLECTSSVKSVGELNRFPFETHAEFVDAYKARRVDIPTRLSTWSVMRFLNSWNDTLWFVFIFNGFALAIGATVCAILQLTKVFAGKGASKVGILIRVRCAMVWLGNTATGTVGKKDRVSTAEKAGD